MYAWRDYISHEIDISKELDADFKFSKIHWMCHGVVPVHPYRALQQYSAERYEEAHKTNLKHGWNASNHNLNYRPQLNTFQHRILCFESRELSLGVLAHRWQHSAAACKVSPSGADLAAPLGSQSYPKPEWTGPQNHRDGKQPDALINDCRALLNNRQEAMHRMAIYRGMPEFIKHQSCNLTCISDEQLHTMELGITYSIKVQVLGLEG